MHSHYFYLKKKFSFKSSQFRANLSGFSCNFGTLPLDGCCVELYLVTYHQTFDDVITKNTGNNILDGKYLNRKQGSHFSSKIVQIDASAFVELDTRDYNTLQVVTL